MQAGLKILCSYDDRAGRQGLIARGGGDSDY
jgi:hypothetical protein